MGEIDVLLDVVTKECKGIFGFHRIWYFAACVCEYIESGNYATAQGVLYSKLEPLIREAAEDETINVSTAALVKFYEQAALLVEEGLAAEERDKQKRIRSYGLNKAFLPAPENDKCV